MMSNRRGQRLTTILSDTAARLCNDAGSEKTCLLVLPGHQHDLWAHDRWKLRLACLKDATDRDRR